MAEPLTVRAVSGDRVVWAGEAQNVIAKTTEGNIGILPGHEPVMSLLAPGGVEIICPEGKRQVIAVDGGFISVARGRVSILSEFARIGEEISAEQADRELAELRKTMDAGEGDDETQKRIRRATAQLRAAHKLR
jgi:F-type H+-transporting ATPase subunit epsilon